MQCGRATKRGHVWLRTCHQQRAHHVAAPLLCCDVQWRVPAKPRRYLDVRARLEQQLCHCDIATVGGPMQRRHAVTLRNIDRGL